MKTLQERSEQMVVLQKIGDRAYLMIQHRETAVVLKNVPCSDAEAWISLQQQADSLCGVLHAALVDYAEELLSESVSNSLPSDRPATKTPEARIAGPENSGDEMEMGAPRRHDEKILYGLPCGQCGAYFDSALTVCPFCKQRCAEYGSHVPAEEASHNESVVQ